MNRHLHIVLMVFLTVPIWLTGCYPQDAEAVPQSTSVPPSGSWWDGEVDITKPFPPEAVEQMDALTALNLMTRLAEARKQAKADSDVELDERLSYNFRLALERRKALARSRDAGQDRTLGDAEGNPSALWDTAEGLDITKPLSADVIAQMDAQTTLDMLTRLANARKQAKSAGDARLDQTLADNFRRVLARRQALATGGAELAEDPAEALEILEPLSREGVARMTRSETKEAIVRVSQARRHAREAKDRTLSERLDREFQMLLKHFKTFSEDA